MWRGTVLLCLPVLYVHILSQPISNGNEDARQVRQLDFTECCPCPSPADGRGGAADWQTAGSNRQGMRALAGDVDDCPCRSRHSDSEGASSILFPTAMRSNGPLIRPIEKKEELKPLLHPEVDLASSVLETLREATDEEYHDALARDAARSMAKAAEEVIFGDVTPQESAPNIVTIIMNPKQTDIDDDFASQASHVQESRFINAPLEQVRHDHTKFRVGTKPPSLLHEIFKLPNAKSSGLDNNIGASDVKETVIQVDNENMSGRGKPGFNTLIPNIKINPSLTNKNFQNSFDKDCNTTKVPDFRSSSIQSKLKEFISNGSSLLESIRNKTASNLSLVPKSRINSLLSKTARDNKKFTTKNVQDQSAENTLLGKNILPQNTKLVDLKKVWKLRDVELVPLQDLVKKVTAKAKLNGPELVSVPIFNRNAKLNENIVEQRNDLKDFDSDTSPSLININIMSKDVSGNCDDDIPESSDDHFKQETDLHASRSDELIDKDYDNKSSEAREILKERDEEAIKCNSNEIEPAFTKNVMEDSNTNEDESIQAEETDNDSANCIEKSMESEDLITNPSNNVEKVVEINDKITLAAKPTSLEREESCDFENNIARLSQNVNDAKPNIIATLSLDKALPGIKENTARKSDTLNDDTNTILYNENTNEEIEDEVDNNASFNPEDSSKDCDSENTNVTENLPLDSSLLDKTTDGSTSLEKNMSMQDLQNMSDLMLQKEEKEHQSQKLDCSGQENTRVADFTGVASKETDIQDPEPSASFQNAVISDLQNRDEPIEETDMNAENSCQSMLSTKNSMKVNDLNTEASNMNLRRAPLNSNIFDTRQFNSDSVQPLEDSLNLFKPLKLTDVHDVLKLGSLPVIDDAKLKLNNLFHPKEKESFGLPSVMSSNLNPRMVTDAITSNFRSEFPSTRLLSDIDFDILQLKPLKSPLLEDLSLIPIKLQSAFGDKDAKLGAPLSLNDAHPLATEHTWKNIKSRVHSDTKKRLGTSLGVKPLQTSELSWHGPEDILENANSHAKQILRNAQRTLESRLGKPTNNLLKSPIKDPNELLEMISRNHEDVNDKLKALHVDFYDRIESMRNSLMDKSNLFTTETRSKYATPRTHSSYRTQNRNKNASSLGAKSLTEPRQSEKKFPSTSRRVEKQKPVKLNVNKSSQSNKINMPAVASMSVPRTVQIPELKLPSMKVPALSLQNISNMKSQRSGTSLNNEGIKQFVTTGRPVERKYFNPFKDSKVKISFSTTPRPGLQIKSPTTISRNNNILNNPTRPGSKIGYIDHKVSPSEQSAKISAPNAGDPNEYKSITLGTKNTHNTMRNTENNVSLPPVTLPKLDQKARKSTSLNSWPRATESAFISKVKDAVKARLSKGNSSSSLKKPDGQLTSTLSKGVINAGTDMARAATDSVNVLEGEPLKENVSYKCRMVCTKH